MSNKLGTQLQAYATGTAKGCQHPIKDVDDNDYCHACNTQLKLKAIDKDAVIAARDAEIARWKKAVEGLTPGGSEFFNDPERCAKFIRDFQMSIPARIVRQEAEIAALRGVLEALANDFEMYVLHGDAVGSVEQARALLTPATPQARTVPDGGEREGR